MRNLKRALSLALASVMLLGMMVVGSSAKGIDDFTDKAEIVNQDAVAVTSAIGMFEGYEDGSFGPENVVTRAEMAVIICTMLYGAGVNVNQFAETNVFTDVPAWAEGYVNLCSSLGIVAGVGDGKFDPNATVTTAQAVLMLCRALGYFQNAADFGDNWMLAATAKGTALGLYGDLKLTANAGLTRDNVAELVFNALTKAVPVQYNELLGVYYNENKGILYSLTYYYTDTLGYKNFDLVYKTNENTDYGRPGTTWGIGSYRMDGNPSGEGNKEGVLNEDGSLIPERVKMTSDDEIITVADTPDFTYTANTKENVIYKAVGKSVVDDYAWNIYVDGAEQAGDDLAPANDKDTDYTYTAKGATTEIYVDDVNETVTVVMINYYMAEVTKVKDGENTVRVLSNATKTSPIDERTIAANGFAVDEYVVITVDVDDDGDSFVASIDAPATAEGSVSYVSKLSEAEGNKDGQYAKLDDGNVTVYDMTMGTSQMLSCMEERIHELNSDVEVTCFGQEFNPSTFAIAKADMMIRGGDPNNMRFGDTLSDDQFPGFTFRYCISNPPFGIDWKREKKAVEAEAAKGELGRFAPGLPKISDGQQLFVLNGLSKLAPGGKMAIIQNGSPLFAGDAGSGPSNIRQYILENDWLDAIVQLSTDQFMNTGISTYIWVLCKDKPAYRCGKVQLIDASHCYEQRRKAIGTKRNDISDHCRELIVQAYGEYRNNAVYGDKPGVYCESKIFGSEEFGYNKIVVERPQRDENGEIVMKRGKPVADTALRDTENVPLVQDIDAYFAREVLPYAPDAWIDKSKTKVGYEIPMTRYFYEYQPPEPVDDIVKRIQKLEREIADSLNTLFHKEG